LVVRNGRVERRAVTVANTVNDFSTVTAGLNDGEKIVMDWPASLNDGEVVKEAKQ